MLIKASISWCNFTFNHLQCMGLTRNQGASLKSLWDVTKWWISFIDVNKYLKEIYVGCQMYHPRYLSISTLSKNIVIYNYYCAKGEESFNILPWQKVNNLRFKKTDSDEKKSLDTYWNTSTVEKPSRRGSDWETYKEILVEYWNRDFETYFELTCWRKN